MRCSRWRIKSFFTVGALRDSGGGYRCIPTTSVGGRGNHAFLALPGKTFFYMWVDYLQAEELQDNLNEG